MRILHVTESHAKKDGGVTTVVNDLTQHLYDEGVHSCVMAATDIQEPVPDGVDFVAMGSACNSIKSLFSSEFKEKVRSVIIKKEIRVIHIHGVWMPLQIVASRLAKEMNIPFVVTSHGMYEPWLWTGKGVLNYLKKKLYFKLISYPVFKYAAIIHGITPRESNNLIKLFPRGPQQTIPNAIDVVDQGKEIKPIKFIFFIGRINQKKGISLLLEAFCKAKLSDEWKLVIAGPEEVPEYAQELKGYVAEHHLSHCVSFVGSVFGEDKETLYKEAWITVVPSYSEVVGMVNLEAALYHCPTITTYQCGLDDWEEGGGILIEPDVAPLMDKLKKVSKWIEKERQEYGQKSFDLVQKKYAWEIVSKQWVNLYADMVEKRSV